MRGEPSHARLFSLGHIANARVLQAHMNYLWMLRNFQSTNGRVRYDFDGKVTKRKGGPYRPKRAYWAAGTGYGHDNSTTTVSWDVDAYLAAQRETDRLLSEALREVRGALDDTGRWPGDMACVGASAFSSWLRVVCTRQPRTATL